MIKVTQDGKVLYRAGRTRPVRFPAKGDARMRKGPKRNFDVFDPLDWVTDKVEA
jgi:hypothetical protein